MSVLLAAGEPVTDGELRDHMVTLLAVGQETTATQLAWFFERVLRCPDVLRAVTQAAACGDRQVLDAAINEAVRARPATMDLGRFTTEPWEAGGYQDPPAR